MSERRTKGCIVIDASFSPDTTNVHLQKSEAQIWDIEMTSVVQTDSSRKVFFRRYRGRKNNVTEYPAAISLECRTEGSATSHTRLFVRKKMPSSYK